jgi:hypothetical protein
MAGVFFTSIGLTNGLQLCMVASPNAKVIITDGKSMMVNNVGEK